MMKKYPYFIINLIVIIFLANTVFAQTILQENFNYPSGTDLTTVGWTQVILNANTLKSDAKNLSFSGYNLSGNQSVRFTPNGNSIIKPIEQTLTGVNYISFVVNVESASTLANGDYFISLYRTQPAGTNAQGGSKVFVRNDNGNLKFGLNPTSSTGTTIWAPQNYSFNTSYLIVLKYEESAGNGNDKSSIFIYSTNNIPSIEPSATIDTLKSAVEVSNNAISLRQGVNGGTLNIDGLKISKTWGEALQISVNQSPVVSSTILTPVNGNTVNLNSNVISYGWISSIGSEENILQKGFVWSLQSNPTIDDEVVSIENGILSTQVDNLPNASQVFFRAFATNNNGIAYSNEVSFYTNPLPPNSAIDSLNITLLNLSSVQLDWYHEETVSGYLVLQSQQSELTQLPQNGTHYQVGNLLNEQISVVGVYSEYDPKTLIIDNLSPQTRYYYWVIPYKTTLNQPSTSVYKIDDIVTNNILMFSNSISVQSDVVKNPLFIEPNDIDFYSHIDNGGQLNNYYIYQSYQLRDGGELNNDTDEHPTTIHSVSFKLSNSNLISSVGILFTSENEEVIYPLNRGSSGYFYSENLILTANDDDNLEFAIILSFYSTMLDQVTIHLDSLSIIVNPSQSNLIDFNKSNLNTSQSTSKNKINIVANHLSIIQQPINGSVFSTLENIQPSFIIHALDQFGNLDINYSNTIGVESNGSGNINQSIFAITNGISTISTLQNQRVELIQFTFNSGSLNSSTSNNFRFLLPQENIFPQETIGTSGAAGGGTNVNTYTGFVNKNIWTISGTGTNPTAKNYSGSNPSVTNMIASNYSGASGGSYVYFPGAQNVVYNFNVSGMNLSQFTNINLKFGFYKSYTDPNPQPSFKIEYSVDGTNYINIPLTDVLPQSSAPVGWYPIILSLPENVQVTNARLRFKVDNPAGGGDRKSVV